MASCGGSTGAGNMAIDLIHAIVTGLLLLTALHVLLFPSQDESHGVLLPLSHTQGGPGSCLEIVMYQWEQASEHGELFGIILDTVSGWS